MSTISASKFKEQCLSLIGALKGKLKIKRSVLSTGVRWNAES